MKLNITTGRRHVGYRALGMLVLLGVMLAGFAPAVHSAGAARLAPPLQAPSQTPQQVAVLVHGWQGGELDPNKYKCSDGIQGPYTSNPPEFGELAQTLTQRGYVVYFARWTTSAFLTITAEEAALCLAAQLRQVRAQDPNQKVLLVGHSMGGLVSRAYLESSDYQGDVEHLLTFGSPHVGVDLGLVIKLLSLLDPDINAGEQLLCKVNPGTCELSVDEMLLFDLIHRPSGAIPYDFVAGNGAPWWWPLIVTEFYNDGIVGITSGVGHSLFDNPIVQGSRINRWRTGDVHFQGFESLFGVPSYFDSPASVACLVQFIAGSIGGPCVPYAATSAPAPQPRPERQFTPTISGVLAAGETATFPIRLDGSSAQILANWTRGDIELSLTTPGGASVTPANAAQLLTGGGFAKQAGPEWFPTAIYRTQNPQAGEWLATLTATNVVTDTDFVLLGSAISPFTLRVEQPGSVAPGAPFTLTARVENAGAPVGGVAVTASLFGPGGATPTLLPQTAPGVYSAAITAPAEGGQYHLSVRADGPAALPYARQNDSLLLVRSADVQITGAPGVQPVDNGGNGRFDTLRIQVPLAVNRAARYVAGIVLRAPNGVELTSSRVEARWEIGAHSLVADLDGRQIGAARLNGPYTVELQIVAADTMQLVVDEQPLLQTAAYSYGHFDWERRSFMPLALR